MAEDDALPTDGILGKPSLKAARAATMAVGKYDGVPLGKLVKSDHGYVWWLSKQTKLYPVEAQAAKVVLADHKQKALKAAQSFTANTNTDATVKLAAAFKGVGDAAKAAGEQFQQLLGTLPKGFPVPAQSGGQFDLGPWLTHVEMTVKSGVAEVRLTFRMPGTHPGGPKLSWEMQTEDWCPLVPHKLEMLAAEDAMIFDAVLKPGWTLVKQSTGKIACSQGGYALPMDVADAMMSYAEQQPPPLKPPVEFIDKWMAANPPPTKPPTLPQVQQGPVGGPPLVAYTDKAAGPEDVGASIAKAAEWFAQPQPIQYPQVSPMPLAQKHPGAVDYKPEDWSGEDEAWDSSLLFPEMPPTDPEPMSGAELAKLQAMLPPEAKKLAQQAHGGVVKDTGTLYAVLDQGATGHSVGFAFAEALKPLQPWQKKLADEMLASDGKQHPWWTIPEPLPVEFLNTGHYGQSGKHAMLKSAEHGYPGVYEMPEPQVTYGARVLKVGYGSFTLKPQRTILVGGLGHGRVLKEGKDGPVVPEDPSMMPEEVTITVSQMQVIQGEIEIPKDEGCEYVPHLNAFKQRYGFVGIAGPNTEYLEKHASVPMLYSELSYVYAPWPYGVEMPQWYAPWKEPKPNPDPDDIPF